LAARHVGRALAEYSNGTTGAPYDPQDLNAYAYSADNPATESDPTGATFEPAAACG
jgi:hypothetical protein